MNDAEAGETALPEDWLLLGLMPDADERAARTAYARKLKTVRPDTDPEGFQALRAAYERIRATVAATKPEASAATELADAAEARAEVDPEARDALVHRFDLRRRRADIPGALAVVDDGLSGSLRMAWREAVEDGLFDSVVHDPSARRDLLQALATRFDWREATTRQEARDGEAMAVLRGRVEAADFVDSLKARERAAHDGSGPPGDRILIRIMGPYQVGLFDRGLEEDERAVANDVMSAVFQHLAEIDDVIDTRTIAALRGALGAAPFAKPLPTLGAAPAETDERRVQTQTASQGGQSWTGARVIWLLLILAGVASGARHGSDGGGVRPTPSPNYPRLEHPAPASESPKSDPLSGKRWDGTPPVPMTFAVTHDGDRLGIDLSPLLASEVRSVLGGVRFDDPGSDPNALVPIDEIARDPVRYLEPGAHTVTLALVLRAGASTDWYAFDLNAPVRRVGLPDRAEGQPTGSSKTLAESKRPNADIRFAPALIENAGTVQIDLSGILSEQNRRSVLGLRLRTAPTSSVQELGIAEIQEQPRRTIPDDSERLTLQLLYRNGGRSAEFVYNPKAALAARAARERATAPGSDAVKQP